MNPHNRAMPTNQEIFNQVIEGIFRQGGPSFVYYEDSKDIICKYRWSNGRKCAAGLIMPDDEYSEDVEGYPVDNERINPWFYKNTDIDFMKTLQIVHDETIRNEETQGFLSDEDFLKKWVIKMKKVADDYDLDKTVLNKYL